MPRYRPDVDAKAEAKIITEVESGTSINKTATKYGVSFTLARQIVQGSRVKPVKYPPPKQEPEPTSQLCTCCNERPKKPGNRFLCAQCAREA